MQLLTELLNEDIILRVIWDLLHTHTILCITGVPMDFFDTVFNRYAYRGKYTDEVASFDDVKQIIQAGIAAPTGANVRTTSYIFVTDKDLIQRLHEISKKNVAPVVIILLSENIPNKMGRDCIEANFIMAAENIWLAATALGYATVLNDGVLRNKEVHQQVRELFNLPEHIAVHDFISIGRAESPSHPQKKQDFDEMVVYNKF